MPMAQAATARDDRASGMDGGESPAARKVSFVNHALTISMALLRERRYLPRGYCHLWAG